MSLLGSFASGLIGSMTRDWYEEDYKMEVTQHPDEDAASHAAHTAGRMLGDVISFFNGQ